MSGVLSKTVNLPGFAVDHGLPADSRLYAATGSPLLFKRVDHEDQLHFDAPWLYIPRTNEINRQREQSRDVLHIALGGPIDLEDWLSYPIYSGDDIVGQVVLPHTEQLHLDEKQLIELAAALAPSMSSDVNERASVSNLFVQALFQRESSPQQFTKRLLSILAHEWEGSCAGAYFDFQGLLNLLLATGDVSRYYRLSRQLSLEKGLEITNACISGELFLPAELLPDQATFLTSAPDLYFVHPGLKCEGSSRYLVIVGPGDLSRRAVKRLQSICSLASSLHESQFHTAGELLDDYRSLCKLRFESDELTRVLSSALGKLQHQIQLSRVVVSLFNEKQTSLQAHVLLIRPTGEIQIEKRDLLDIPDKACASVLDGRPILVPDLTSFKLDEAQARRRYLDNVASEYCMPIETASGVVGIIAFGSPVAGDYLAKTATTLSHVAGLASVCVAMNDHADQVSCPNELAGISEHDVAIRLNTIRRLTESNLHSLSESVSVAVGQADLLKDARTIDDPIIEAQRQAAAADTLCAVADQLDAQLAGLRQISLLTAAPSEVIDGGRVISALPTILAGLIQQEKDSKNIDLRIMIATENGLYIHSADIFDDFVPLAMAIVEQSICSGGITVEASGSEHTVTFSMRFARRMLAGLELPRLLTELFPQCELILDDSGNGQMVIGDSTLVFHGDSSDECVVTMECIRSTNPSCQSGNDTLSSSGENS